MTARRPPNLVVMVAEGMPVSAIGAYGNDIIQTPNLDRLAEKGVLFENSYCTQPLCTPARSSLHTGRYPNAGGCPDNEHTLPATTRCFPELGVFSNYRTAQLGPWELGDEVFAQHGFQEWKSITSRRKAAYSPGRDRSQPSSYEEFLLSHGFRPDVPASMWSASPQSWFSEPSIIPECLSPDAYLAAEAIDIIRNTEDTPFIMWLSFMRCKGGAFDAADDIYDARQVPLPANFDSPMGPDRHLKNRLVSFLNQDLTPGDWKQFIARYWAGATLVDRYVGQVLGALDSYGLADNTIVVFTSEHGHLLGEHRMRGKSVMLVPRLGKTFTVTRPWADRYRSSGTGAPRGRCSSR